MHYGMLVGVTTFALVLCAPTVRSQGSLVKSSEAGKAVTVRQIAVVDDEKHGVKAQIFLQSAPGKETRFADTNDSGIANPNATCQLSDRLLARPTMQDVYLPAPTQKCAPIARIVLRQIKIAYLLKRRGERALSNDDPELAVMLLLEANHRLAAKDPKVAKDAQMKGFEALARILDTDKAAYIFDTDQNSAVLTATGKMKLIELQTKLHVTPANGELNYPTVRAISGRDIGPYIRFAYETEAQQSDEAPK
jgi:hypothetical protein